MRKLYLCSFFKLFHCCLTMYLFPLFSSPFTDPVPFAPAAAGTFPLLNSRWEAISSRCLLRRLTRLSGPQRSKEFLTYYFKRPPNQHHSLLLSSQGTTLHSVHPLPFFLFFFVGRHAPKSSRSTCFYPLTLYFPFLTRLNLAGECPAVRKFDFWTPPLESRAFF